MHTASLDELHERSNKKIDPLNDALSLFTSDERKLHPELADPLVRALAERHEILNASSRSAAMQIICYGWNQLDPASRNAGFSRFRQDFVIMREIQSSMAAPARIKEEQLRQMLWEALPSSSFKRFQEIFCEPRNYIVPKFTVTREGQIVFSPEAKELCRSVSACIVSPDRISDELAVELGIVKFEDRELRSPRLRYLRKSRLDVPQGLKHRWENAVTLSKTDRRIAVIQKPGAEHPTLTRYPNAAPMPPGLHGSIFLSGQEVMGREHILVDNISLLQPLNAVNRRISLFRSVFDGLRKTMYQRASYEAELKLLSSLKTEIQSIATRVESEWRKGSPDRTKVALLKDIKRIGKFTIDALESDVNEYKVDALKRMTKSQFGRDSLDRLNPRSTITHMQIAVAEISERLKEIVPKGGYNERDKALLITAIEEQTGIIKSACKSLSSLPYVIRRGFKDRAALLKRLEVVESGLAKVTIRPLSTTAGIMRLHGAKASQEKLEAPEVHTHLVGMQRLGSWMETQLCAERIKAHLINVEALSTTQIKRQNIGLLQHAKSALRGFDGGAMMEKVAAVNKRIGILIEAHSSVADTPEDQIEWATNVRKTIDELDFEELAWKFAPKGARARIQEASAA